MGTQPLYQAIQEDLKEKIESGIFNRGDLLPTEARLCQMYNVSRVTVRQALNLLVNQKYVKKVQGSGTRVIYNQNIPTMERSENLLPFFEEVR